MRLAENESRRVGMKFEAPVELSQERSDVGLMTPLLKTQCTETCWTN